MSTSPHPWPIAPGTGLLVVGHGTADPVGVAETLQVAELVAGLLPGVPVEAGFLEIARPAIGESLAALSAAGCTAVVAAPLLLFTAGHAERDVPEALQEGAERLGLAVTQAAALGLHPDIVALSRQRRAEAVVGLPPVSAADTVLVLVGRGSSSPTAPAQLADFAAASAEEPHRTTLGFVAAARPTLAEGLAAAAGARRVIVQPHLLFRGHVEEQVSAAVSRARREHPDSEWLVAGRLGADRRVAKALVERATAAPLP